jgi:hypothetical protein
MKAILLGLWRNWDEQPERETRQEAEEEIKGSHCRKNDREV